MNDKPLGEYIKEVRTLRALTLHEVEEFTGISNAYLSQLESGKIKKPGTRFLYLISQAIDCDLWVLFKLAGFIPDIPKSKVNKVFPVYFETDVTTEEQMILKRFLKYIRNPK